MYNSINMKPADWFVFVSLFFSNDSGSCHLQASVHNMVPITDHRWWAHVVKLSLIYLVAKTWGGAVSVSSPVGAHCTSPETKSCEEMVSWKNLSGGHIYVLLLLHILYEVCPPPPNEMDMFYGQTTKTEPPRCGSLTVLGGVVKLFLILDLYIACCLLHQANPSPVGSLSCHPEPRVTSAYMV